MCGCQVDSDTSTTYFAINIWLPVIQSSKHIASSGLQAALNEQLPGRQWQVGDERGDVISAAGGCQYLAVKMAANTEAVSVSQRQASGIKI
jgi:hypothetical protein